KREEERGPGERNQLTGVSFAARPTVFSTDHTEGQALKRRTGTWVAVRSNFWPCTEHPMDHGLNGHCLRGLCPGCSAPTRYIPRLWAAITIQEDTRNWKNPVDRRAASRHACTGAGFPKKPGSR
ncbi:hypothetical protein KI387_022103, partial [Taxus chinensis]